MTTTEVVNVEPQVTVNGQAHAARRGRRPRHPAGVAAGRRVHRQQGGLRGGRVRRLRGAGGPPGRRRVATRWTAINACLVPAAGLDDQEVITAEGLGQPGGCTRCSARWPTGAARNVVTAHRVSSARWPRSTTGPTAAGTAARAGRDRARHQRSRGGARLGATAPTRRRRVTHPTTSTGRTASTCTRCPETCAAAPATGRSGTPPTRWARPDAADPLFARLGRPAPAPAATRISSGQGAFVRPGRPGARRWTCWPSNPDARLVAGSTDWGVELNIRHARAALTIGIDRLTELRAARRRRRTGSTSARR